MENIMYWIWLSKLNIHPLIKKKLLDIYEEPKNIWDLSIQELKKIGLFDNYINEIKNMENKKNLDKYLSFMQKNNIEIITCNDSKYPHKLKELNDTPILIYAKGNTNLLHTTSVAIIGCRNGSEYGKTVAKKMSYELAKKNITIVSGLAKGIDAYSHTGTLLANGKTVAVLGNGLDTIYPNENVELANNILKNNGLIISEYIIGTKPVKNNFPERNRIISGLSDGVLVVEAKEKSGTFITVDYALEQGKEVYAIPGNILSPYSFGTNTLIKNGAKPVTKIDDIIEDFLEIYN